MMEKRSRRQMLKYAAVACTSLLLPEDEASGVAYRALTEAWEESEIHISLVSSRTVRINVLPIRNGQLAAILWNGTLVQKSWAPPVAKLKGDFKPETVRCGNFLIGVSREPLSFAIQTAKNEKIQLLTVDRQTGAVSFDAGTSPLLGLGEGGPQFDRRGSVDAMISGQGGYKLATHGGRVPIPWIIGTAGWALFFHQPFGTFDFTGERSTFRPASESALPLDIFFIAADEPATIMSEYARLTGHAEMLPRWALGYQQSHRTLASREEVLQEAKTFREKKLPCDALIYLGTGFCPSGWNTANGSFAWNSRVFPDPKEMLHEFHSDHFRVVLHSVILTDKLRGMVRDGCESSRLDEEQVSCYWSAHRKDFAMGVDGWWPDEGDPLDVASCVTRHRMYWEGPQLDRPNVRPYSLHRNGFAGMQRYASILWSGDVYSKWETLKTHIPIAINTALTGIPYWGTDIGGFVPTSEFTAELYVRWFQFGAFCPLFRSHGRTWKLRLPWGWNTGDPGPIEIRNYDGAAVPDSSRLHNPQVETICRKYLELRYRMLPYLYSLMHECTTTGMPLMRSLWLHYPDDPKAVACGDAYLWGPYLLVAPVVEKGAATRSVYLPRGVWSDFWTGERLEGGREIGRAVDLETVPLYVRAGSILPLGPVKQYADEKVDQPTSISIYPGADASFLLYEDDGVSFNYRHGEWMGIQMSWEDASRVFRMRLAPGSKMLPPAKRHFEVKLDDTIRLVIFDGAPAEMRF
jgi:alpha-glucosidase (family GH31 glycosyl hydrolase)